MNREHTALQRPISDDRDTWHTYWKTQGQSWRTEPEIAEERQAQLSEYRAVVPDIQKRHLSFQRH
jgi:hypothetical protein